MGYGIFVKGKDVSVISLTNEGTPLDLNILQQRHGTIVAYYGLPRQAKQAAESITIHLKEKATQDKFLGISSLVAGSSLLYFLWKTFK